MQKNCKKNFMGFNFKKSDYKDQGMNIVHPFKIYSFDVFDTCISRTYEHPTDLFFHLGYSISPTEMQEIDKINYADKFKNNRIFAERSANRKMGKHRNTDLENIYQLIELPEGCTKSPDEVKELEIIFETNCSYAIYETKNKIEKIRNNKNNIIFISDMYLSEITVSNLLARSQLTQPDEKLYVSSKHIETKHSGKLYQYVLKDLGVAPESIIHHGDNYYADIKMAIKNGLHSEHIKNTIIFDTEKSFKNSDKDFNKSILNSIPKFLRLANENTLSPPEYLYFGLIAPCIVGFTAWTLAKAKELNLKTLYFVSRDAELPFKIAQKIASYYGIEVKYLLGSRKAWLLPSIDDSDSWKGIATPAAKASSLNDALERLQFSNPDIERICEIHGISHIELTKNRENTVLENLLDEIMKNPETAEVFERKISAQRKLCVQYFSEQGLLSNNKWALVDSGWALNTQGCLQRILRSAGYDAEVLGLYFGVAPAKFLKKNSGNFYSFTEKDFIYFHRAATVEHCIFPSAHNSLSHYQAHDDTIAPVFMENGQPLFDLEFSEKLHAYTISYTDKFLELGISPYFFNKNKSEIVFNIKKFISDPNEKIALHLSQLSITIDVRHSQETKQIFFEKISFFSFIKILFSSITNLNKTAYLWPEASAKLSNPFIKLAMRILLKFKHKLMTKNVT